MTFGAAGVVVAGFAAAPTSAVAAGAAPMSHISTNYAHVGRAPRLPAGSRNLGAAPASRSVSGAVALAPRNPAALERAAAAVSNPKSASFHHYIAKGTFAAKYGPSAATISAVEATLRASHLSVGSVSANGLLVHFHGTVGSAEQAFRTHIANFRLPSGRTGIETTSAVSFPASLASSVVSVVGLDTVASQQAHVKIPTHPAKVKAVAPKFAHPANSATPCPGATGAATEFGGLTDDQIAHAYGADGLYSHGDFGAGQTVAIYELEPFATSDIKTFDTCYFGASAATQMIGRLSRRNVDGGPGTGPGSGESLLDIENVSALAPAANIEVYQAPNGNIGGGPLDLYNQIVQDDSADVVSTSWGECEALLQSTEPGYFSIENEIFEQAALQGQSVFSSAGDSGSNDCAEFAPTPVTPLLSTDDPASQPFVTAVGGTTITDADDTPTEHTWNDGNFFGGGGGGVSQIWGAPSWQQPFLDTSAAANAVASGDLAPCQESAANGAMCREVPDVSAEADQFTGAITVFADEFGGWLTFGGTSSSAPLWAAMLADINASSGCEGTPGVGFASPSLYAVASIPADYKASFNDLTAGDGNNDVYDLNNGSTFATRTGYDMASGLGTPQLTSKSGGAGLAANLCALAAAGATPRPAITSLAPDTVTAASPPGPVVIDGTGFTGATALSIGGYDVPSGNWSVTNDTTITVSTVPSGLQALTGGFGPQDGSGRALVSVTGATGATSLLGANSSLLYVEASATSPVPSVAGVTSFGGSQAGGNTVTVFGSGFNTSPVTEVTVGGVDATSSVHVLSDNKLTLTVPAYNNGTTECLVADDQANDVCQAQVVVSNANGSSPTSTIQVPYSGAPFEGTVGGGQLPACVIGNTCEVVPADTEYDYFPAPTITSVTTTSASDPTAWASEEGTTIATIEGKGFDYLGFLGTADGDPTVAANGDFSTLLVTPTKIQVVLNGNEETTEPIASEVSVMTLAGTSVGAPFSWAGVPNVSAVSTPSAPNEPVAVTPVTGGATMKVTGKGFQGVLPADGGAVDYSSLGEFGGTTTQIAGYSATSDTSLTATTPSGNPGLSIVQVCTLTDCSFPETESQFDRGLIDFYQAGDPKLTSVSASSGPASGGTRVVIHGVNLSDAVIVKFGSSNAEGESAPGILTNGSNTEVIAIVPPGKAGSKVNITVSTVESLAPGGHASAKTSAATFTYKASVPSAPRDVTGTRHGKSVAVHWKAPVSSGGHAITHYRVSAISLPNSDKKGAKKPPTVTLTTVHGSARSSTVTGLRAGWTYEIQVRAVNSLGRGLAGRASRFFFITDPA